MPAAEKYEGRTSSGVRSFLVLKESGYFVKVVSGKKIVIVREEFCMGRKKSIVLLTAMVTAALSGCGGGDKTAAMAETAAPAAQEESRAAEGDAAKENLEMGEASGAEEASEASGKAPAASDGLITVGVVNSSPEKSEYRLAVDTEMKNMFTEENGYAASFSYQGTSGEQIAAAKQFIADGVDYLLLSAEDAAGWESVLMDAQDADVRVILFDQVITVDENLYEAAVVSDVDKEGEDAVSWLKGQGLGEYQIIHLQGVVGTDAQKSLTLALDAQMEESGWKIVVRQSAGEDADKARRIVQSVIDSGEPFNVIYAENETLAKGAVAALDGADISHGTGGSVKVMSFGSSKWALEELLAQNWDYDGQRSARQAFYIDEAIKKMESGDALTEKVIVMEERGFEATTITAEDILHYGI